MHSDLTFLFPSCLQDESLCNNSTPTRMYCKNASASKDWKSLGGVKLLRVFSRFWISRFSSISELSTSYLLRNCPILIHSARCWKIYYCIQRFLGYERARPAYVAFSFPLSLICYVAFALVDGEQGSDAKKWLASASEGLLNCLARELYATREECANANCENANEGMRRKRCTCTKTKKNNQLYVIACVYMYMCVYARPRVLEIWMTRESNFVRFLNVCQNFYINYLLHKVFITSLSLY